MVSCGFFPNWCKSQTTPSHVVSVLGFILDTCKMIISLDIKKEVNVLTSLMPTLHSSITIHQIACLIGKLISVMWVLPRGKMYYRCLEHDKLQALHAKNWHWNSHCKLSVTSKNAIRWWICNLPGARQSFIETNPTISL